MDFDIKIFSGSEGIDPINDNVDVEIMLNNGQRYSATFFTIENIQFLLNRYKETKECLSGLYFWASDIIIVEKLSEDIIKETIQDLIRTGEFYTSFSLLKNN